MGRRRRRRRRRRREVSLVVSNRRLVRVVVVAPADRHVEWRGEAASQLDEEDVRVPVPRLSEDFLSPLQSVPTPETETLDAAHPATRRWWRHLSGSTATTVD